MPRVSKHWDPAWRKPSVILNKRFDPAEAALALAAGYGAGYRLPPGNHELCRRDDGLLRHATVGPDYAVLVAADDRLSAAQLQQQIGRLTFYFICSRPRVRAVPGETGRSGDGWRFVFEADLDDGSVQRMDITQPIPEGVDPGPIDFESGGAVLLRTDEEGRQTRQRAALLAQGLFGPSPQRYEPSVFDLDLHYIGRARGRIQETCALDRLEGHPKYQQAMETILSTRHRNRDVWLILSSGTTMHLTATDAAPEVSEAELTAGSDRAREMLSESHRVDLTEALLINYFKPPLNDQHTGDLDLRSGVISRWRRADITGVTLAFATDDLRVAVKSEGVATGYFHAQTTCL